MSLHLAVSVPMALYRRHLGLPVDAELEGRVAELAAGAFAWYREHGEPWQGVAIRQVRAVGGERVDLEKDVSLECAALAAAFRDAGVHAVGVVASSAGARVDEEIDRLWKEGKPDEAMFLNALAVAVAEHLRDAAESWVAAESARDGVAALPRRAPGYPGWDLGGMAALVSALEESGPLRVLPSGGLLPQKSTVAVIGLTRQKEPTMTATPGYAYPERALEKWSRERLTITSLAWGRLHAKFRFDGKTCASLQRPFVIDYEVELAPDEAGTHCIARCSSKQVAGDKGLRWTCAYREGPEAFLKTLEEPPPLVGEPLEAALAWQPDESSTACLCTAANRNHKWRIVLQTIHHALRRAEKGVEHDASKR